MPSIPLTVLETTEPATGLETCTPYGASGITPATQDIRGVYFQARRNETVTKALIATTGTAAATVTLIRLGVWTLNADGSMTLVASTANDTALFAATVTEYTKSFSASLALQAGKWYGFAPLQVATTPAGVAGINGAAAALAGTGGRPRLGWRVTGQTDLPSTINAPGGSAPAVALNGQLPYAVLAP